MKVDDDRNDVSSSFIPGTIESGTDLNDLEPCGTYQSTVEQCTINDTAYSARFVMGENGKVKLVSLQLIDKIPEFPHWISVKDRLPEVGLPVLVFGKSKQPDLYNDTIDITHMSDRNIFNTRFRSDPYWVAPRNYYFDGYEITHWMMLPNDPEDDE